MSRTRAVWIWIGIASALVARCGVAASAAPPASVLLISIDTLRADRLSSYGYGRRTSPHIDALLERGARFTQARTVETLTAPALASMLTSLPPHEHGSTRNGLRVRPDLPSLSRFLRRHGYRTAAFVGSWTLRDRLWGMSGHFDEYASVLTQARWLGLLTREARADDINERALGWLARQIEREPQRPFFLWVHYVEPHAPYELQREYLTQIGIALDGDHYSKSDRYDSEIAAVDHQVSRLLSGVSERVALADTLLILVSDHGESLGEHGYWGHGRHLFEPTLRVPLGIVWPSSLETKVVDAPAVISDLPATIVGLLGLPVPAFFQGFDWTPVLRGRAAAPADRSTFYQAHRGAVGGTEEQVRVRQRGLLEVARLTGSHKEIYRVTNGRRWLFDLAADPGELEPREPPQSAASESLREWLAEVRAGLVLSDELPPPSLEDQDLEALRALGYID